ncbi:MAG: metallophosphoesterase [Proteiniphilum sp.]|uniref:metallophosphoesterase n=1 Tax=Proteiniphilum sp. TaxID=1926877 RepID=UPI002ABA934E|nr:metallophosphoesterase [Proteiniphilum sp.]MDY9919130.1 metallophosphoesterase [Proteiniphilum sp.]
MPDTQVYSRLYPEIFHSQTEWIVQNADSIAFVLQQGDITDHNSEEEWQNAVAAFSVMDGKVPYTFVPGNHDLGPGGSASNRDAELFNKYLPLRPV